MDEKQLHSLLMLVEKDRHIAFENLHKIFGTESNDELERVLIKVICEGTVTVSLSNYLGLCRLFQGKIDERNSVFIVTSFTYPNFDKQHFEILHGHIDNLLSAVRTFHDNLAAAISVGDLEALHEFDAVENDTVKEDAVEDIAVEDDAAEDDAAEDVEP